MSNLFTKARDAITLRTTYRLGMLQTRAYRAMNAEMARALKPYDLTPPEWAMLGTLHDMPSGARFSVIADEVGVEPPFVTVMAKKLISKGLVIQKTDAKDSRAKLLCMTAKGKKLVPTVERKARDAMRPIIEGLPRRDLLAYLSVLIRIAGSKEKS